MNAAVQSKASRVTGFRSKLLVAIMVIVSTITALGLYFADRNLTATVASDLQRQFQGELAALHHAQEIRYAALVERCRALVRKPRIHAALEDGALELLYPSAEDELRDILQRPGDTPAERAASALHAEFYRFLDRTGALIPAGKTRAAGALPPDEEARLSLTGAPGKQQIGYLRHKAAPLAGAVSEIIAMPIISTETGEVIAALVLGFKPFELGGGAATLGMKSGVWVDGQLDVAGLSPAASTALAAEIAHDRSGPADAERRQRAVIEGAHHEVFYKRLNPESVFPPAYEVCLYPLAGLREQQRELRWQVVGAGVLFLLGGLVASHFVAGRLSDPVEKLAVDSEENRAQRERAEAALELSHGELQRSARFSADASHQLKTPVTVLRAGLEELLARENLSPEECHQLSALIHQTFRLSSLIEDLLLLSRMDAGRMKLEIAPVDLSQLLEAALDDLDVLPDELDLRIETAFPRALHIAGEKRYTAIILQNLLENARKYNQRGGLIRITARAEGADVLLSVGNTGRPIPPAARAHIFERFHRGAIGENVPGYGLGLNLARQLASLHGGDLRLARSEENWTEFEVRFRLATAPAVAAPVSA
ncbi:MAG: hypothetical protein RIQ93_1392 [Verrucomicrobiota bacterium]